MPGAQIIAWVPLPYPEATALIHGPLRPDPSIGELAQFDRRQEVGGPVSSPKVSCVSLPSGLGVLHGEPGAFMRPSGTLPSQACL